MVIYVAIADHQVDDGARRLFKASERYDLSAEMKVRRIRINIRYIIGVGSVQIL